ncbi:hypothetical protein M885DRAFT_510888 [Pelagophyceae sp. CCMP2097]|nr:hypothetical protein M885DRAFT_510888 [Pelagophyceae sp. CCMP2097]|mmetsp:Transcript_30675/g.107861  ORF Transcript_30675/g.107861 Transcript_30675/m.107861 type:complete len:236 (-) Transcript_30675:51-758(-)
MRRCLLLVACAMAAASPDDSPESRPSCAVVFNSGVVRKHDFGARIDTFDRVYRINMLNRTGHELHLGTKWTHEVVSFQHELDGFPCPAYKFAATAPAHIEGISVDKHAPRDCKKRACCRSGATAQHAKWTFLDEAFSAECRGHLAGTYKRQCSSGFSTTLLAKRTCGLVVVFGAIDDGCYPYHYLDPMPRNCNRIMESRSTDTQTFIRYPKSFHSFNKEHEVLREWAAAGEIELQ